MRKRVNTAFELESVFVELANILPVKKFTEDIKKTRKYRQIAASIQEIGIIEPPVVARQRNGVFLMLDGHLRIEVLKELGVDGVACLVATDDEAFTYNKRINRLATIQEHKMILKAIKNGVPQERIAKALDVNVSNIREKRRLLEGICPEAVELLKEALPNYHVPIARQDEADATGRGHPDNDRYGQLLGLLLQGIAGRDSAGSARRYGEA